MGIICDRISKLISQSRKIVALVQGYNILEQMNKSIELILLDIMKSEIDEYVVCKQICLKSDKLIVIISVLSK